MMTTKKDTLSLITQAAFLMNASHQMLILQLPDNRWQLPGGKLRRKEQWESGLRREIREEIGITNISIIRVLYIDNWNTPHNDYYRAYFLCTTFGEAITLSSAHINYEWISAETNLSGHVFTHLTVKNHIKVFFSQF